MTRTDRLVVDIRLLMRQRAANKRLLGKVQELVDEQEKQLAHVEKMLQERGETSRLAPQSQLNTGDTA